MMSDALVLFKQLLPGLVMTIELVVLSCVAGMFFCVPLVIWRRSKFALIRYAASSWCFFFRGSPLLVQMFLIYYGVPQLGIFESNIIVHELFMNAFFCAWLALTLNASAYMAEILFGAIKQVSHGEVEAATSYGMDKQQIFWRIIFPQSWRQALPAFSNEVVLLIKASSIASTITVMELTGVTKTIVEETFLAFELYAIAGVYYIVINYAIVRLFKYMEIRFVKWRRPQSIDYSVKYEAEPAGIIHRIN